MYAIAEFPKLLEKYLKEGGVTYFDKEYFHDREYSGKNLESSSRDEILGPFSVNKGRYQYKSYHHEVRVHWFSSEFLSVGIPLTVMR